MPGAGVAAVLVPAVQILHHPVQPPPEVVLGPPGNNMYSNILKLKQKMRKIVSNWLKMTCCCVEEEALSL